LDEKLMALEKIKNTEMGSFVREKTGDGKHALLLRECLANGKYMQVSRIGK
jgi:hypothetical protein